MAVSSEIGRALQEIYRPASVGLMIAGLEVPHSHIHLVPIDRGADLDFANVAASVEREDLESAASAIRKRLTREGASGVSA